MPGNPAIWTAFALVIVAVVMLLICFICFKCRKEIGAIRITVRKGSAQRKAKNSKERASSVSFVTVENQEWSYGQTRLRSRSSLTMKQMILNFVNKYIFCCCCSLDYSTKDVDLPNSGHLPGLIEKVSDKLNEKRKGSMATYISADSVAVDGLSYQTGASREPSVSVTHKIYIRIIYYCNKYLFCCCCCLDYKLDM